jgi:hypothetical protein
MQTHLIMKQAVLLSSLLLIASSLSPLRTQAEEPNVRGAVILTPMEKQLGGIASGAVEDTLKACLARIPEDASAGQRMLAEHSCRGEEGTRKLIQVAPQF